MGLGIPMATAQEIINSAAKFAGILAEGQQLESSVDIDALNRLNRMVQRWRNNGVDLGLGILSKDSEIYIDLADEEALELNLALRLMVRHRRQLSPGVSQAGLEAFTELQAKYCVINEMQLDTTLTRRSTYNVNIE